VLAVRMARLVMQHRRRYLESGIKKCLMTLKRTWRRTVSRYYLRVTRRVYTTLSPTDLCRKIVVRTSYNSMYVLSLWDFKKLSFVGFRCWC